MALHFAFRLGTLAFVATLFRSAMQSVSFVNGLQDSFLVGLVFLGIGFAIGEISRHIVEELAEQEFAVSVASKQTSGNEAESTEQTTQG